MLANRMMMASAVVPWIVLVSGDWQGDTGSFTLGTGTVAGTATDKNVRTNDTLIGASQDFDFQMVCGILSSANGPLIGFCDNGTITGADKPTVTNPVVYAKNNGTGIGWANNSNAVDDAKSADWMSSSTIGISRRGSTLYGLIDEVLDHTFTGTTSGSAGKLFIGAGGTTASWGPVTGVQYRLGPNLPVIA